MLKNNYVSYNGYLKVNKAKLLNQYDEVFILKGISTHGIQWYGNLVSRNMLKFLKDELYINSIRIAMYTEEEGYIYNNDNKNIVKDIIKFSIDLDLYVVIDWHILTDNNPNIYLDEAISFFDEMSKLYCNCANVLYEICKEPNGETTWEKDIKLYALSIISVIRKNNPKSIVIVGTVNYSQGVDIAADSPINCDNILYSLHFYAGTHREDLRKKFIYAINKDLPIIVSEFGVSDAQSNSILDFAECDKWFHLLKKYNISIFNWSLSTKNEASSLLVPGARGKNINKDYLSLSGKYIKEKYKNWLI